MSCLIDKTKCTFWKVIDFLYSFIPENDFRKLKNLAKFLSKGEIELLKEIAEKMRKDNPMWGV